MRKVLESTTTSPCTPYFEFPQLLDSAATRRSPHVQSTHGLADRNSMADRPLTRVCQQSDRESSYYQNTEATSSTDESSDDWRSQTPIQSKSTR
ncbi:hypothetical protein PAAG_12192 [Paracoccidioides lutzii Pb01]|uniref:Uncharacterized protein n=1 Tax=Paracoccidioides lutzii (strain ATCC MYA-826 / Pb01) TaxID=502779 RepID=A0A0A2VJX7_PARBA|nr:hypothetical protein PAAG_12192 [Paracoccidioides lutzii Pb01]KGQ01154.1 hypothetical protein PAAG_12192 [Paracoccidioides lutzii Pb01]